MSASRPLEPSFASVQEIKQFGKRRKLNDTDRRRLAVHPDHQSLPRLFGSCRTERLAPRQENCLGGLEIQINGCPVGMPTNGIPEMTVHHVSPSRGLDREDLSTSNPLYSSPETIRDNPWKLTSNRLSLHPIQNPPAVGTGTAIDSHFPGQESFHCAVGKRLLRTSLLSNPRSSSRSMSQDTVPCPAGVSLRGLGINLGFSSTQGPSLGLYCSSPVEAAKSLPSVIDDASNCETPSWLQQSCRHVQCDDRVYSHLESIHHTRADHSNLSNSILNGPVGADHTVPVKIFGQLVRVQELHG